MKLRGAAEYEMRYIYAEAESEKDIPEDLQKALTRQQQWRLLQYVVQYNALVCAVTTGLLPPDNFVKQKEQIRKNFLFDLEDKIAQYGF